MEQNIQSLSHHLNSALLNLNRMASSDGLDRYSFAVAAGKDVITATEEAKKLADAYLDLKVALEKANAKIAKLECSTAKKEVRGEDDEHCSTC